MNPWNVHGNWVPLQTIVLANVLESEPSPRQRGARTAHPASDGSPAPVTVDAPPGIHVTADTATWQQIVQWPTWAIGLGLWFSDAFKSSAGSRAQGGAQSASPTMTPATSLLNRTACPSSTTQLPATAALAPCWMQHAPTFAGTSDHNTTLICYAARCHLTAQSLADPSFDDNLDSLTGACVLFNALCPHRVSFFLIWMAALQSRLTAYYFLTPPWVAGGGRLEAAEDWADCDMTPTTAAATLATAATTATSAAAQVKRTVLHVACAHPTTARPCHLLRRASAA